MAGKSLDQRISEMNVRIQQMEAKKDLLDRQRKERDRKARTRCLIQIGAIMERLGIDTPAKAAAFQQVICNEPQLRKWLGQILSLAEDQRRPELP